MANLTPERKALIQRAVDAAGAHKGDAFQNIVIRLLLAILAILVENEDER